MKTMSRKTRQELLYAAENGIFHRLRKILELCTETDIRDYYGNTPLILAARSGNTRTVSTLLDAGADIHARNRNGENALLLAAREAHPRVVRLLLEHGALCEHHPIGNRRALALFKPDENLVYKASLVNSTTDPSWEPWCSFKKPAELRVQRVGRLMYKVVELFISYGADVDALDDDNETPLHNFINLGMDDCVRLLVNHSPDLNAVAGCGDTPLAKAIVWSQEELACMFLASGADPKVGSPNMKPILVAAGGHVSIEFIQTLIEAGADVTVMDEDGETALIKAIGRSINGSGVTKILLDAGADPDVIDARGFSASDHALMTAINGKSMVVPARWKNNVKASDYPIMPFDECHASFVTFARDGAKQALQLALIEPIPDSIKTLALFASIYSRHVDCCRLLLDNNADPNAKGIFYDTPLTAAAQRLDETIAGLLLLYGALPDDTCGNNSIGPLCIVCQSWAGEHPVDSSEQRFQMAGLLLKNGADVNRSDCDGQTPLRQAVFAVNDIKLADLLLRHGARSDLKDGNGISPLQLAEENCSNDMVKLLRKYGRLQHV